MLSRLLSVFSPLLGKWALVRHTVAGLFRSAGNCFTVPFIDLLLFLLAFRQGDAAAINLAALAEVDSVPAFQVSSSMNSRRVISSPSLRLPSVISYQAVSARLPLLR